MSSRYQRVSSGWQELSKECRSSEEHCQNCGCKEKVSAHEVADTPSDQVGRLLPGTASHQGTPPARVPPLAAMACPLAFMLLIPFGLLWKSIRLLLKTPDTSSIKHDYGKTQGSCYPGIPAYKTPNANMITFCKCPAYYTCTHSQECVVVRAVLEAPIKAPRLHFTSGSQSGM